MMTPPDRPEAVLRLQLGNPQLVARRQLEQPVGPRRGGSLRVAAVLRCLSAQVVEICSVGHHDTPSSKKADPQGALRVRFDPGQAAPGTGRLLPLRAAEETREQAD